MNLCRPATCYRFPDLHRETPPMLKESLHWIDWRSNISIFKLFKDGRFKSARRPHGQIDKRNKNEQMNLQFFNNKVNESLNRNSSWFLKPCHACLVQSNFQFAACSMSWFSYPDGWRTVEQPLCDCWEIEKLLSKWTTPRYIENTFYTLILLTYFYFTFSIYFWVFSKKFE